MKIDFTHHQSAHCENGVVSNLMKHNGFEVSEPMVFGIGSGLLFCYVPLLMVNHAPAITYRAMPGFIFKRFANRVGIKIKREKFKDPAKAKARLDENLEKNNPVGLQVGVYNLLYFPDEYRFHFNAHNMVVYGKEGDTYLISDPVMETVTTLTDKQLEKVRFAKGAFAPKGHMYYPIAFPKELHLEKAIIKGIKQTCKDMLAPVPIVGVKGIRMIAKLIRKWPKKKGTKVANHYLGQVVRMQEEIGTGGGGFRYIFAAFLQESSKILGNQKLSELSKEMTSIGDAWRDFALEASRIYKNRSPKTDAYNQVADMLDVIADREEQFFKKLRKAI
ncbi:BtrH N-terminal domain-containing protein [Mangrovimonas sp. AS39]|uniref:BtrH N-terminal domain-containing protein n=1 Tax=Mangrovimonas TaxID=1211036 RepID=UPI0006B67C54|nr:MULTISPECIES: BtrH N-terminal domain-containing protein [Mangrovimonas]MCF1190189.1 BtrH N-terminal domain-containing protein [Mangrovimonas futianensis]MCF1194060.1 BtrH N-terminal domain-containing protein [Mangrovimonas futianensis]NIK90735.1 BtrH N-terminal domain-containing protein [Mangrovimonas sp. CR14]